MYAEQIGRFQAALRLAGERDHAEEDADFGVAPDDKLHADITGLTPTTVPGVTTIHTAELERWLTEGQPIAIDLMLYSWGRSIPGAVGLKRAGGDGSASDATQDRLRRKMQATFRCGLSHSDTPDRVRNFLVRRHKMLAKHRTVHDGGSITSTGAAAAERPGR